MRRAISQSLRPAATRWSASPFTDAGCTSICSYSTGMERVDAVADVPARELSHQPRVVRKACFIAPFVAVVAVGHVDLRGDDQVVEAVAPPQRGHSTLGSLR